MQNQMIATIFATAQAHGECQIIKQLTRQQCTTLKKHQIGFLLINYGAATSHMHSAV